MKAMQSEIINVAKSRGFINVFTGHSKNTVGESFYVEIWDNDFTRMLAKFRISDHSVTNTFRLLSEYHVTATMTAEDAIKLAFDDNNADKY